MKATGITTAALMTLFVGAGLSVATAPTASANDKDKTVTVQTSPDGKQVWIKTRAKDWDTEHRTWVQRGGYTYYRIPEDKYGMYFGPEHVFRINTLPYQRVSNEDRYQYNGYWMSVVDPWPQSWPEGWWENDDVYLRYDNGYYLYNTRYPDAGLAVRFVK